MVVWTNCAFLLFLARTCTLYHHVIAVQSVNAEEVTQRRLRRSIPGRLGRDTPDETPAKYEFKTREQAHELQVLIGLYDATDGFNWLDSTGWLSNGVIPCDFKGVACNVDNYVTALDFRDNNLNGTLPASMLWDLQYLERVDLSNNPELTVDFQTDVSLLWETIDDQPDPSDSAFPAVILINETEVVIVTRQAQPNITTAPVHYLDVSNTATSSLAGINRLADTLGILDISNSKVKSDSVGTIRKLSQLTTLGMNHVKFGASVDGFFSQIGPMGMSNVPVETMSNLQYWYASNASLIGTIPSILGLMKTLRVLDMSLNPLQGTDRKSVV